MQQYFAEYGLAVPAVDDWHAQPGGDGGAGARSRRRPAARRIRLAGRGARVRHRSRALRRRRAPRPRATPARRSNVDAMLRDLSEVRIGDPVVHEQHGIGRYLGLVTTGRRRRPRRVPPARLRQRRQALRAGGEPAPHRPLQRRRARIGAAARARQRPVGEGQEARGAAGARHRCRAAEPLRPARRPQGPRVPLQRARLRGLRRGLRLRGDARPERGDRGGDQGPDRRQADGPAGLRRRRLRQDRGGAARGLRRAGRRQAGRRAGADDAARPSSTSRSSPTASPTCR